MDEEWTTEEQARALRITQVLQTALEADRLTTEASGRAVATGVSDFVVATYAHLCVGTAMTTEEKIRFLDQYLDMIHTGFVGRVSPRRDTDTPRD